jgi:starch phosphorylase
MDQRGLSFEDAWQEAKNKIVYTNHTLVAAGNQSYSSELIQPYAKIYAQRCHCDVSQLLAKGQDTPQPNAGLSITRLALNASRKASGVSTPHTKLAQQAWPEYSWVNITNGVHQPTWQKPEFRNRQDGPELWNTHRQYKHQLMELAVERTKIGYDPDRLIIAWARRITSYKQLDSIFNDLDRLENILRNPARPIQLVVAGKTHPGDNDAKKMLQQVIQLFQTRLSGVAVFLPDYDIPLAQHLVAGVDVWLNTPKAGMEASGTSGMKASSNGVLQATVADGWSAEIDWNGLGWTLDSQHPEITLYDALEQEIAPLFYDRNQAGIPIDWIDRMSRTIEQTSHYTTDRVLEQYREHLYLESAL